MNPKHTLAFFVKRYAVTCPMQGSTWSPNTSLTMMGTTALFVTSFVKPRMLWLAIRSSVEGPFRPERTEIIHLSEKYKSLNNLNDSVLIFVLSRIILAGENRTVLNQYIKKSANDLGQSVYECSMCGQKNSQRVNVLNHVESVHFPNSFVYSCKYCLAEFYSKNARNVHVSRNHKNLNKV